MCKLVVRGKRPNYHNPLSSITNQPTNSPIHIGVILKTVRILEQRVLTVFVVVGVVEEPLSPPNGRARKMTRSWLCQSGARISEAPAAAEE